MSDAVEIHFLFEDPLETSAQTELYEALLDHPALESSVTPSDVSGDLERSEAMPINATFKSIHPSINFYRTPSGLPDYPNLLLHLEGQTFKARVYDGETVAEHVEDTIELVTVTYEACKAIGRKPYYVFGGTPTQTEQLRTDHAAIRTTTDGVDEGRLEELYWIQILRPAMVADVGTETLIDAPAHRVEQFPDDSMLFVAHENPRDVGDDYRALLEQVGLERD